MVRAGVNRDANGEQKERQEKKRQIKETPVQVFREEEKMLTDLLAGLTKRKKMTH